MNQLLLITLFSVVCDAFAQTVDCEANNTFVKLPTEAQLDFSAAMIANGLYKYGSKREHHDPYPYAPKSNTSYWQHSRGTFPAIEPYNGDFPAAHPIWQLVPPTKLKKLRDWSRTSIITSYVLKELCNQAVTEVLDSYAHLALQVAGGQVDTYENWQWLTDYTQEFPENFQDAREVLKGLNIFRQAASDKSKPLLPDPLGVPPINEPLVNWVNGQCAWAQFCRPNRFGQVSGCVDQCQSDVDDGPEESESFIDALTSMRLWVPGNSGLVCAILAGNIYNGMRIQGKHRKSMPRDETPLFTNIRVEFPRGGIPSGIRQIDLNSPISTEILSILENGWQPPKGWNIQYDNGAAQKRYEIEDSLMQRDDLEDHSCIPDAGDDLKMLVYNLWLTQFKPAAEAGISESMEFSAFHDEFGGPDQIHAGGEFVVKIWTSQVPDWKDLLDPAIETYGSYSFIDEDRTIPSIEDPRKSAQGVECFTDARPEGSFDIGGSTSWPRRDWIYSVTDACYQAWGKSGVSPNNPTTGFTYQGKGKNWDKGASTDGLGWGFRYKPQGCQAKLKCQDFTGLYFDAQDTGHKDGGDLNNLFTTCTQPKVNPDQMFRGGRLYHVIDSSSSSGELKKSSKRGAWDPNHPNDPSIPGRCGVIEVWPLFEDMEITTWPGGQDHVIKAPVHFHVESD